MWPTLLTVIGVAQICFLQCREVAKVSGLTGWLCFTLTGRWTVDCPLVLHIIMFLSKFGMLGPLYTRSQIESLNWELELAIFDSLILGGDTLSFKPKWLRAPPIFKLLVVWANAKWPCSECDFKGRGIIQSKEHTWQAEVCLKAHWLEVHKMRAQTLNIPKLPPYGGSLEFWPRACRGRSTWDPLRSHLSVSSSQVESGFEWTSMRSRPLSANEKVPFFDLSTSLV